MIVPRSLEIEYLLNQYIYSLFRPGMAMTGIYELSSLLAPQLLGCATSQIHIQIQTIIPDKSIKHGFSLSHVKHDTTKTRFGAAQGSSLNAIYE